MKPKQHSHQKTKYPGTGTVIMKHIVFFQLLLMTISISIINGLFISSLPKNRRAFSHPMVSKTNSNVEDYDEMRNLVLSLSQTPTDSDRRTRLASIFEEALARPNGQPKQFVDLFDKALTNVGNEVQTEARKKFAEKEKEAAKSESSRDVKSPESDELEGKREKSAEELQMWALVDMMVQSKTIVKKTSGELGSKGTFQ